MKRGVLVLIFTMLSVKNIHAQNFTSNGGFLVKTQFTFGNQNKYLKVGVSAIGTLGYKKIRSEHNISLALYKSYKRHTYSEKGIGKVFEFFSLIGSGENRNLLGTTVSNQNSVFVFNRKYKSNFRGIGFGVEKEIYPDKLAMYGVRRGKLIFRVSQNHSSFYITFLNDLQLGKIFYGEATDFGETGSLYVGYSKIETNNQLYQTGIGITMFTPPANYSLSPRNIVNSSHGRKNVWYTPSHIPNIFYGNMFFTATYQKDYFGMHGKLGINSQKAGAYIQNKLHDGFGLNPRYPWKTSTRDKIYYELDTNIFYAN